MSRRRAATATKARYELRGFVRNSRGRYVRVRSLTIEEDDPHYMALHLWRLSRAQDADNWRYEVRDNGAGRGKLAPLVTYEELLRRSKGRKVPFVLGG
jgi:hypothetical protein